MPDALDSMDQVRLALPFRNVLAHLLSSVASRCGTFVLFQEQLNVSL